MFPTTLDNYHNQAEELYRRAENHRLIKSFSEPREWGFKFFNSLGFTLIAIGEHLINKTQTAH